MPAPVAFKVLTEFKFEIGQAVANAAGLQSAVDNVSQSAQDLQFQLAQVGFGFAASLGLVGGGALGLAAKLIGSFNEIEKQQIKIGGILYANKGFVSGVNDANTALVRSKMLMIEVAKQADKFGLNEGVLSQIGGIAFEITGKVGISPEENVGFARNILKAAPQLGLNAGEIQGQIFRALRGGAGLGDPAFAALSQGTGTFAEFSKKVGGVTKVTKAFNKLPTVERFKMLNKAFGEFTRNSGLLSAQANTISSLVLRIKQNLFGFAGALTPLGEALTKIVKGALVDVIKFIRGDFKQTMGALAQTVKLLGTDTEGLIIKLQELSQVAKNFQRAGTFALLFTLFAWGKGFAFIGKHLAAFGTGRIFFAIGRGFKFIFAWVGKLGPAIAFLGRALVKFFRPLAFFLAILTLITRAFAIARLEDAKAMPAIMTRLFESFNRLLYVVTLIFGPLDEFVTKLATGLSVIFRISGAVSFLVSIFETLEMVFVSLVGGIGALLTVMVQMVEDMKAGNFRDAFSADRMNAVFNSSLEDFMRNVFVKTGQLDEDRPIAGMNTVFSGNITLKQEFKEKFEPDRIAFSTVEALKKLGQNASRGRGQTTVPVGGQ